MQQEPFNSIGMRLNKVRLKHLKRIIPYLVLFMLAFSDKARSQGSINFNPYDFINIICTGPLPPGSVDLPFGVADLTNNVFSIYVHLGPVAASQASVLQMEGDGSLTPVFEITNQVNSFSVGGITVQSPYVADQSWQVTDDQANSLLAGNWYVQFTFSTGTDIGAIVPVPEPSSFDLLLLGAGFILYIYKIKSPKPTVDCGVLSSVAVQVAELGSLDIRDQL